jgi:hypothetical protein
MQHTYDAIDFALNADRRSRVHSADCHVCASQHRRSASLIAFPATRGDYYD